MANTYFVERQDDKGDWYVVLTRPIRRESEARALVATLPPPVRIKRNHEVISDAV